MSRIQKLVPRYVGDNIELDYGPFVIKVRRAFEEPFLELVNDLNESGLISTRAKIIQELDSCDDDSISSMRNTLDEIRRIVKGESK